MHPRSHRTILSALLSLFLLVSQNVSVFAEEGNETVTEEETILEVTEENNETVTDETAEEEPEEMTETVPEETEEPEVQETSVPETEQSETAVPEEEQETATEEDLQEVAESEEPVPEETAIPEETAVPENTEQSEETVTVSETPEPEAEEELPEEENDQDEEKETEIYEADDVFVISGQELADSESLLESYLYQPVNDKNAVNNGRRKAARKQNLSGFSAAVYDYLSGKAAAIASGSLSSAHFTDTEELLANIQTSYTAEELGVSAIVEGSTISNDAKEALKAIITKEINAAFNALLLDAPYELYWYDKTVGMEDGYSLTSDGTTLTFTDLYISMYVSASYSADGTTGTTNVDASKTSAASAAIVTAQNTVSAASGQSDYEKLAYYKNWICEQVEYNHDAAGNSGIPYGDPWQIIYVFDGNEYTNVVCEGYSKAFKYLCDLTEFNNSAVEAYTVTGTMTGGTGAGPHMWDLVHMDNGKNYVVDVTNCDGNSIGAPDLLFMKAPVSFETDGYTFDCNGTNISYVYDGDTISAYSESERQISSWDYGTEPADISDYEYTASETVTITKYNGTDPEVVIPSEIEGKPVTGIGSFAFANNKTLTKVTIPDTVLVIDAWAFNLCSSLSEVVMSNNVTEIRTDAFNGCSSLSGIFIPASVTYIGELAFNYCGLTSITVDHANTVYDSRDNCNAIIETATNTLLFGSSNSFIPEGIETIRANAFGGRNLENVVIPESVTTIENYAFAGITAYSIEIPASVTSIGQNPFAGCINLAALTVSPSNSVYDSRDNCNAIIETAENKLIAGTYNTVIPESVTMISVGAFEECQNITSITVPGNVNEIGGSAFTRSSLSEVIINDGTAVIGSRAFGQCSSLTSVTLPASITNIGRNAFYQCTALATVNYTGTEEQWNAITVESGNECLTNAEIHFGGDIENPLPAPENFIDDGMGNISWDPVEGAAYYDITMESLEGRRRFALAENNIANSFNIYDYQSQFGTDYKYAVMVRIEACSAQGEEFNSSLSRFIYSFDPESPGIKAEWQYPDYVYWNFDSSYVTFDIEVGSYYIFELLRNDQVIFTEEKTAETEQIIVYYSELEETGKYSFRIRFGNDKQDAEISERIINGYTMDNTPVIPENLILTEDGKASFDVVTSGYYMVQLYFGDDNQVYGDSAQYLTSHYETDLSWYMNQNTGDYHLVVYTGHTSEEASNMDNAYTSNTVHFVSSRLPAPENVTVNENGIITWDPVSGADYYNINLKRLNGNSAIWSDGTNDTSFNINNHGAFVYGGWDSVVVLPSVQACSSSYPDNNSIETVSDKAYSLNDYNKGPIEAENCPSYVFWDTNNRNVAQFIIEMGKWYVFEFLKDDVVVFTETKQVDSEYTNIYPPALSDPGRYSFTIRIGDTQQDAENSTQKINSYVQKYNLPAEPLDTPSDLKWEDGQVSWKTVSNTSHYRVAFINTDTDTEEYVYDAYSYGADRATHWLDDSIRREYSHGWKFTVQAISENPSDYSNSEAAYSSEKQFADRQFTVSNTWVDIYSINTWSNPVSFEYTVNGEPGDPSELEYAANYDSLTFNVNADNTLTFIATKDGMYEFTVMYDGEYIQTMWINVYSSAYRYANINTGNTPIRAGNEYTFDVLYEVNDCEGDYSEISFEASEGNGNNCVTITPSADNRQIIINALRTGSFYLRVYCDKSLRPIYDNYFEVRQAVPQTGLYFECDLSENQYFEYINIRNTTEVYFYMDGQEVSLSDLTVTFTDPTVAGLVNDMDPEWNFHGFMYEITGYGTTDMIFSYNGIVLKTVHITVKRPVPQSVSVFRNDYVLKAGDTAQMVWNVYPENAEDFASIIGSTDDSTVAVIDNNGLITAVGNGETTVRLTMTSADGRIFTAEGAVYVGNGDEIRGGDNDSNTPIINAASIALLDNYEYEISFVEGYPVGELTEDIFMGLFLAKQGRGIIELNNVNIETDGKTIRFSEKDIRRAMEWEEEPISAGEYEARIVLRDETYETYYLGKMTVQREIDYRSPEGLKITAADDNHSLNISCGDNYACDVYLNAIYDERFRDGVAYEDEYDWTHITFFLDNGRAYPVTGSWVGGEYLIPEYSPTTNRMVSLTVPSEVIDKACVPEGDYLVRIVCGASGYHGEGDDYVHYAPSEAALVLKPQDMTWNEGSIFSFRLPYGTWYLLTLTRENYGSIWQDVNVVSDELGYVNIDMSYLIDPGYTYSVNVKTAAAYEDVTYIPNGYRSETYRVSSKNRLENPENLQFNDDGSISWDAVGHAVKYLVTLICDSSQKMVLTTEPELTPDWDSMGEEEDSYKAFTVKAVGDQITWANSSAVWCGQSSIKPVAADQLEVTVNLDGKVFDGITHILTKKVGKKDAVVSSITPDNNKLNTIKFSAGGTYTYQVYPAVDNPSIVPNYDTYTVTYDVTLDDNDNVLKVSKPDIKDNDGKTVSKIVFDMITPKPAEYAPEVIVNLNGAAVTEAGLFTVRLKDDEGAVIQTKQNDANGTVTFDNIEGLDDAKKYYYRVEAESKEGYILPNSVIAIVINNIGYKDNRFNPYIEYIPETGPYNGLTFDYTEESYAVKSGTVKLELTQDGTAPVSVFNYVMKNVNTGDENDFEYILCKGAETEKEITFTSPGSYRYEFTVLDDNPGLKYDHAKYYAEYEVEEKNGSLAVVSSSLTDEGGNEVSAFAYTVTSKGPASFTPSVKVRLDGETPADGLFTFVLKDDEGIIQDDVKVNAGENIPFADLTFNQLNFTDIGNYYFTVNQQGTDGQYILDRTIYHIAVEVGAGDNDLEVTDYYYDYTENEQDYTQVDEPVYENTTPESIPLESISLDQTELSMHKGDSALLTVTYNPDYTTDDKTVIWTSSNEAAAVVNNGTVTAVGGGSAVIRAAVGDKTAECTVTVNVELTSISLDKSEVTLKKGDSETLTVIYNPEDTTDDRTVTWTTSNEAVATVSADGTVTAVSAGTAAITAKVGEHTATAEVKVVIPLENITLNKSETTLKKGEEEKLEVTITPEDTTDDTTVTWTTSNEAVATVSADGTVTAVSAGTAVITAKVGEHTATAEVTVILTGWVKEEGIWYYYDGTGAVTTGWKKLGEVWYYFDSEGKMQTGWEKISGKWYYFNGSGAMQTGWQKISDKWYYFNTSGAMLTGWQKISNTWYYFNSSGEMLTGWQKISDKWYYFNGSGEMLTGWQKISDKWYYFNTSGAMLTGWQKINNVWYYFNSSGAMLTGWQKISDKWYYFNTSGAMLTGWQKISNTWYYFESGGAMKTGWLKLNDKWYYFESSGAMVTGSKEINGKTYNFDSSGKCLNP